MDVGEIWTFLERLGCRKISVGAQWVRSTCPLEYRHGGGADKAPSFAVRIAPKDQSQCRCLACGAHGSLYALVWKIAADGGRERPDLFQYLRAHNQLDAARALDQPASSTGDIASDVRATPEYVPPSMRKSNFVRPEDEPQAKVPEDVQRQMVADMPDHVLAYLTRPASPVRGIEGRGLSEHTVREWGLGWHPLKQRITIPIREETGKLVAISGRRYGSGGGPKYLHSRFKRDRVLYGEHRRVEGITKGYLFEGFFHVIYASQLGYFNVFARMGTHLSRLQALKLVRWLSHLVIVPDGDKAGKDAAERDARTLQSLEVRDAGGKPKRLDKIEVVKVPEGKDIDGLKPSEAMAILGPLNSP